MKLVVKNRYWITPNDILNNDKLSWKAKWLFWYLQSKPENWDFAVERIQIDSKDWREATNNGIKELEDLWYLVRNKYQNSRWQWEWEYILYETPIADYPSTENPSTENPQINKEINTNKEIDNIIENTLNIEQSVNEQLDTSSKQKEKEKSSAKKEKESCQAFLDKWDDWSVTYMVLSTFIKLGYTPKEPIDLFRSWVKWMFDRLGIKDIKDFKGRLFAFESFYEPNPDKNRKNTLVNRLNRKF